MTEITHKILLSERSERERFLVLKECERVASIGGMFQIENRYSGDWYSFITIHYPDTTNDPIRHAVPATAIQGAEEAERNRAHASNARNP